MPGRVTDNFVPMHKVLPEGESEGCRVDHFTVSDDDAKMDSLSSLYAGGVRTRGVRSGTYARLRVGSVLMMTDTFNEQLTNREFLRRANGDVLIAGLGLGMVLLPVLRKQEVSSVLVVEKYQGVIDLVEPAIRKRVSSGEGSKLTVVQADVMEWYPPKGRGWDTIYFDIWPNLCTDNLDEIATLNRRYARRLNRANPLAWKGSWEEGALRAHRRRERSQRW